MSEQALSREWGMIIVYMAGSAMVGIYGGSTALQVSGVVGTLMPPTIAIAVPFARRLLLIHPPTPVSK